MSIKAVGAVRFRGGAARKRTEPRVLPVTTPDTVRVVPVTPRNWDDFTTLFQSKGAPHYCWCTAYRDGKDLSDEDKKASIAALVDRATPIGVLAYRDGQAIGWCSIAPRQSYARLAKSRTMARTTPLATQTWAVLCFFILRGHRRSGVARMLLDGAVEYAFSQAAEVVEGFPHDTSGVSSTHRGHSALFASCDFRLEGDRWVKWKR
jgi:GNAT superfamily N-acetyltransferase